MNGYPNDELLSAYLDDELGPAERAEVERLLAADPAARQSLEQLRAVSAEVRALPRQGLGEDLSKRVLETAQQRRLQSAPAANDASLATPLSTDEPLGRRLISRRNLVWLTLTAAVAILISIDERWHLFSPQPDRKVARAPAESFREKPIGALPPSSISAPPKAQRSDALKSEHEADSAPAAPLKDVDKAGADTFAAKSDIASEAAAPAAQSSPPSPGAAGMGGQRVATKSAAKAASKAGPGEYRYVQTPAAATAEKRAERAETPRVVIECQLTSRAAQNNALQNLLAANGIAWSSAEDRDAAQDQSGALNKRSQEKSASKPMNARRERVKSKDLPPVELRAEATEEQLQAVLAALASQPESFVAVTVQPRDQNALVVFDQRNRAAFNRLLSADDQQNQPQPRATTNDRAEPKSAGESQPATTEAPSNVANAPRRQATDASGATQNRQQLIGGRNVRQPIVFVIRVVEDLPGTNAEQTKSARPASRPAESK